LRVDWPNLRVLVTGAGGFLGSYLVEELAARGAKPVTPSHAEVDLVDREATRAMLERHRPEVVFHLAAEVGGIEANRLHPARYLFQNLMMGMHLFEEARAAKVQKLVATGTICAYPKFCPTPFKEEDLWNGYPEETNAPYGLAKKMLLVASEAYRKEYGLHSIVLFPVNLYGPRDNFDPVSSHVIPALIRKCVEAQERGAEEIVLWGDGTPTREFLHARDCARGLVLAAERYDDSAPVNLGSGHEIAIATLARMIAQQVGFGGRFRYDTDKPNGQPRRRLDTSRAEQRFGFLAAIPLAEGLEETIGWYRAARQKGAIA
jgi:GDP-L-fucose synthase